MNLRGVKMSNINDYALVGREKVKNKTNYDLQEY